MNPESAPPESSPPPETPPRSRASIAVGFSVGVVFWVLPLIVNLRPHADGYDGIPLLILAALILPPLSLILALIPWTRRVGLGLLLACALGWLVLGAICGGVFK